MRKYFEIKKQRSTVWIMEWGASRFISQKNEGRSCHALEVTVKNDLEKWEE